MSRRGFLAALAAVLLAGAAVLWLFERQLSGAWLRLGLHPEILARLERSAADQKRLSELDPARRAEYRRRFDEGQHLLNRLRILDHNRERIGDRYRALLLGLVGTVLLAAGSAQWLGRSRRSERLRRLRDALLALSAGREVPPSADRRGDALGRIGAMVEEISREVARDRRRLSALQDLSVWQEAARRQAHELRTPLAAARLTLSRLAELPLSPAAERAVSSLAEDFDRLVRFTHEFTSFARLPEPRLAPFDLAQAVAEFAETFAAVWSNLTLVTEAGPGPFPVRADRERIRQVLVNLLDNSSQALEEGMAGTSVLRLSREGGRVLLDVADDGPGLAPEIAGRAFEPYATTKTGPRGRAESGGMGLGLAIARKILLDQGGDLELVEAGRGATFRLSLPLAEGAP
jgi:signal transduction histidine kinase